MKIIPAIDVIAGKCVRLTQGNYSQCKIYSESPLQVARIFEEAGATRLHLVDLEGAKSAGVVNIRVPWKWISEAVSKPLVICNKYLMPERNMPVSVALLNPMWNKRASG